MEKRFQATDLTTVEGLKKETYTAVVRYFAPAVAIIRELGITAGMPISSWMTDSLRKDRNEETRRPIR
jgi:hypothetical protein